jgi:hypothetical protein
MTTLNDEILRATGGATVNEGLASWYSKTASESLNDAEARWLFSQVAVTTYASVQDMWKQFLGGSGALPDLLFSYWSSQP